MTQSSKIKNNRGRRKITMPTQSSISSDEDHLLRSHKNVAISAFLNKNKDEPIKVKNINDIFNSALIHQ